MLTAGDLTLIIWLVAVKSLFSPFPALFLRSKSLNSVTFKVRGLELHLLEGGLLKDLCAYIKSTMVLSKFGR